MNIYITVKNIGKRKKYVEKERYDISDQMKFLKDLLIAIIKKQVTSFNNNKMVDYLSANHIEAMANQGKVEFGVHYNEKKANVQEAIETMIQAFEDGLFKVFINDQEYEDLNEDINIKEDDNVTFIKLTMLAGRQW